MILRDVALVGDGLKCTFMNHDVSPSKTTSSKKTWHSKTVRPLTISPSRGATTSGATDRARSSNTISRHKAISLFNLGDMRCHLEEEVVLATSVYNEAGMLPNNQNNEFVLVTLPTKAFGTSFVQSSSRICIDKRRVSKSPKRSPTNRFLTDSEATLKRKPIESLAKYRRTISLSNLRCDKVAFLNKKAFAPTSHQIVLPIQSPATSRRENMKILPRELHFSHQRVGNNDRPLTIRAMTVPGPLEPASQEVKRPSASKRDAFVGIVGDGSTIKSESNLAYRAHNIEAGKQSMFQSAKFSSPRDNGSKARVHRKHVYVQAEKNTKNGAMGSQTTTESLLGLEQIQPQFNMNLKLKNIVARLRPEILKAESQACNRQSFHLNFVERKNLSTSIFLSSFPIQL